ncbi:MAG: HAD family phosphatase [Candidatus Magasanikbacteria bacterium]|nr:HAD family phosphatase [Candidatus Magasanikbacteria bacterium]
MKKFLPWRAVLFDMDGIIIDSEVYWYAAEKKFAEKHGLNYTEKYRRGIMAVSPEELARIFQRRFGLKEKARQIIMERNRLAMDIYCRQARLLPGFLELMKKVRRAGFKTALVSSSPFLWVNPVLRRFKLKKYFDNIISAEEMPDKRGKPHPAIYLWSAKQLKVKPRECLVFEDSVNGVKAAKAAGMFCVAVPDKRWIKDRRGIGAADLAAASLKDKKIFSILNL